MRHRRLALAVVALVLGALFALAPGPSTGTAGGQSSVELHLFWLRTCPHCASAREFLADLAEDVPELVVLEHEVSDDPVAQQLFVEMTEARGATASAVPTIIIGERIWTGFDSTVAAEVRAEVEALASGIEETDRPPEGEDQSERVDVPFFGDVDVGSTSMLVSTVVIAFVDGVNPCSLWVLSILLALVLHSGSRRRVALVGGTFLAVTTALYALYIVGAYSLLDYASYLSWIQRAVAAGVAVFAVINIRDYFRVGEHAVLAIPERAKPGIYRQARSLLRPERSTLAVMAGTIGLAAGVSLVETPCSAALPLLWTDLLAAHDTTFVAATTLFALYMVIFLIDELVLFGAAVVTMRATHLQEHHGRFLRLITGAVMLGLAGAMLVDPGLLTTLPGTLAVFTGIVVITLALVAIERLRRPPDLRGAGRGSKGRRAKGPGRRPIGPGASARHG